MCNFKWKLIEPTYNVLGLYRLRGLPFHNKSGASVDVDAPPAQERYVTVTSECTSFRRGCTPRAEAER